MPEFGIYNESHLSGEETSMLVYTIGVATRLTGALPWAKKKSESKNN
jgi:hypothetical protein